MKAAIYFNELQPLLYGYYICKGVIFFAQKNICRSIFGIDGNVHVWMHVR